MNNLNFRCAKCSNTSYETGEIRAAGGFWTKVFDIQNEKFSYIACSQCKYTEFYKAESSDLGNIFDFIAG